MVLAERLELILSSVGLLHVRSPFVGFVFVVDNSFVRRR